MAANDPVISSKTKVLEGSVGVNKPNSEAVNQQLSASINGLIDSDFYSLNYDVNGYFANTAIFTGAPFRVQKISDIVFYQMGLLDSGNSGSGVFNTVNVNIYDENGAFVNSLFGAGVDTLSVSGNNGFNISIGRVLGDNPSTFDVNTAGHVFQYGALNFTTLQSGWVLVPFVSSFSNVARSIRFELRLREQ
jgi:hypothetical protein